MTISLLTPKLLLRVFQHAALEEQSPRDYVVALTTITAINSSWRGLAIGHDLLWANIHVKLGVPRGGRQQRPQAPSQIYPHDIDRVRCFLQRSKKSPITVLIIQCWINWTTLGEHAPEIERGWRSMYDLLVPHMHRCQSFGASFTHVAAGAEPLRLLQLCEPTLLQNLTIRGQEPSYGRPWPGKETTPWGKEWNVSPTRTPLKTLRFSHSTHYLPDVINVPWPILSTLDLEVHKEWWPNVCATLSQLPNLTDLSLKLTSKHLENTGRKAQPKEKQHTMISLPLIKRITTNDLTIWYNISTPVLSSLTVTSNNPCYEPPNYRMPRPAGPAEDLLRMLALMPVRNLTFSEYTVHPQSIPPILHVFTGVETLHLRYCYCNSELLDLLAQEREWRAHTSSSRTKDEITLPALKRIVLEDSSHDYDTMTNLRMTQRVVDLLRLLSLDVRWTLE
ncbi:hypothetical protein DL93DRAFT_1095111 [Clavulina sp. PMI_390]|nr:hypothetical protein DL93DRAFT_1095111 [Clavulina sp. PMI_390]